MNHSVILSNFNFCVNFHNIHCCMQKIYTHGVSLNFLNKFLLHHIFYVNDNKEDCKNDNDELASCIVNSEYTKNTLKRKLMIELFMRFRNFDLTAICVSIIPTSRQFIELPCQFCIEHHPIVIEYDLSKKSRQFRNLDRTVESNRSDLQFM